LEKKAARQAAPFRNDEKHRVLERKRPGRPEGHAGVCRGLPDHVDEEIVVRLVDCPHCRGPVGPRRKVVQYIEELPLVRPHVTRLITEQAECPHCQTQAHSTHPLQVSLAEGAAAVRLGPRALGLAAPLTKQQPLAGGSALAAPRGDGFKRPSRLASGGTGPSTGGFGSTRPRVVNRATPNDLGREGAPTPGKTTGPPVYFSRRGRSRSDQQSSRAPVAPGRHCPQGVLRQQNAQRRAHLGNPHQSGRHLCQAS